MRTSFLLKGYPAILITASAASSIPSSDCNAICGGVSGCAWTTANACYTDWTKETCYQYSRAGYFWCPTVDTTTNDTAAITTQIESPLETSTPVEVLEVSSASTVIATTSSIGSPIETSIETSTPIESLAVSSTSLNIAMPSQTVPLVDTNTPVDTSIAGNNIGSEPCGPVAKECESGNPNGVCDFTIRDSFGKGVCQILTQCLDFVQISGIPIWNYIDGLPVDLNGEWVRDTTFSTPRYKREIGEQIFILDPFKSGNPGLGWSIFLLEGHLWMLHSNSKHYEVTEATDWGFQGNGGNSICDDQNYQFCWSFTDLSNIQITCG
eukprot:Awhi_evm1s13408